MYLCESGIALPETECLMSAGAISTCDIAPRISDLQPSNSDLRRVCNEIGISCLTRMPNVQMDASGNGLRRVTTCSSRRVTR